MEEEIKILSGPEIKEGLRHLPGWGYADDKIGKDFVFQSFSDGIKLISELTPFCDRIDHHPDIHVYYKKVRFELQRFDAGGKVTNRDFVVAREIEKLFRAMYPQEE